jgi:hypothetical protein
MSRKLLLVIPMLLLAGAVGGCDSSAASSPTSPSVSPTPSAPVPPAQGQITVLSVQPESGATIVAEPCDGGYCSFDPRFTFDVQLDRSVDEPWVTVSLFSGSQRCASSGFPNTLQALTPLQASTATKFEVSFLALSGPNGTLCQLPKTTTRMVVELWAQRGRASLLTQEFALGYNLTLQ